jgi:imidazolonepropionase-like amidohydrolase
MSRAIRFASLAVVPALAAVLVFAIGKTGRTQPKVPEKPGGLVLKNAVLYTGIGDKPITKGLLAIQDGKIAFAGPDDGSFAVNGFEVRDADGAVIIPGLVDTHSHIGLWSRPHVPANSDGNEMSGPVQTGVRAIDALQPDDPGIRMAVAGGITTANVMPGSGNVIGGQTIYVKLRGRTVEEMRITGRLPDGTVILGGLKMANGENPKGYGKNKQQAPFTRMKVAALQREQFLKAREYKAKKDAGEKVDRDLTLEPIVEVLERKRTVHFHSHRADDLMTAVRIAEEFGFELVLQHATEGYRIAEILAKKKIPVSLTLVDSPGGKAEVMGLLEENAAILEKAGVAVTINTDDSITESRFYLRTGAIAVRGGMSEMSALKALTITPAKLLHLDHRLGSLEKGKDADFVVLSGTPFSTYTHVLETYIDGKRVFNRASKRDWGYQAGGFALPDDRQLPAPFQAEAGPKSTTAPAVKTNRDPAGAKKLVILAGRIHTGNGPPIERGAILVDNGRIAAVLREEDLTIPGDAAILSAAEVTPGLIDAFAMSGLSGAWNIPADQDQDELSDPNQSDLRALDGFNPHEPLLEFLRANGTTIVHAAPGRSNILAGQSAIFRTEGLTAEACSLRSPAAILVNLGEAPKEAYKGKGPHTRMGVAALVRKAFTEADAYRKKAAGGANNAKHEALVLALEGKVPVYFAAHRADDIATALRIASEFKLKPVIALGTEAYRMAGDLKKAGVPVVVHPTMQRAAASMETIHAFLGNAAVLSRAEIPIAICTGFEGYVPKTRVLRHEAAMAAANGLGQERALRAVTLDAARLLGISDKYGSIEKGKVADLVLYDGDPFEHATHVTLTLMNGAVVFSRGDYLKLPFERRILPLLGGGGGAGCCMGMW